MAVVIVKVGAVRHGSCGRAAGVSQGVDSIAGMAVGDVAFANSTSWAAVVVVLLGGGRAANLLKGLAVVTSYFDSIFCGGELLAFFLPLAFCLQSSSSICSAKVSSCSLWVAGSVWSIFC